MTDSDVQRIADSLGKAEEIGGYIRCLCPTHPDTNPSLDLKQDKGKFLYKCRAGCSQDEVGKELRRRFPEFFKGSEKTSFRHRQEKRRMSNEELARKLWCESLPAKDKPVETYLKQRIPNINAEQIPACIKYLPEAYHSQTKKKLRCLVAPFTVHPAYDVQSISRTYLNDKGTDKANVDPQKAILGAVNGGAIVLDQPTECLGIAEGLESALVVREIVKGQIPIWATGTATNLANVKLPALPSASEVVFFCDYDDAGLKAVLSRAEKARKEGRNVKILRPVSPFIDWNDAYVDAVKNASEMSLESLSEVVHEEEELKRLGLDKDKLKKENTLPIQNVPDSDIIRLKTASEVDLARHLLLKKLEKKYDKAILYDDGAFWRYGETHWQQISYESLAYFVHEYDGKFWSNHKGNLVPIKISDKNVLNVIKRLQTEAIERMGGETHFFHDPIHRKRGINCLDGFIEVKNDGTASIIPHNKEHRQRHTVAFKLPDSCFKNKGIDFEIDWDQEPWKNSKFRKFWNILFDFEEDRDCRDKIGFFGQLAGVALSGMSTLLKQPKAIILLGESANNGKSQLQDLLSGMLAPDDVCHIDPEYFSSETRRLTLAHKLLNTVAELSGKALESKHFKEIITGEATDARELFKMPVFFHPIALHIWATNKTASFFGGIDEGVKRRLIIFPFDKPILQDKQIAGIAKQIIQEEGHLVLAWALKGLMRVVMNEDYVIPQICPKALENWIGQSDSAIGFTQECVRFEEGLPFKSTQDIYDNFREWHIKEGHDKYRIISKNAFGRKLNANLPKGIIPKQTEQSRGYINLKLINVSEHHTEQSNIVSFSKYGSHK